VAIRLDRFLERHTRPVLTKSLLQVDEESRKSTSHSKAVVAAVVVVRFLCFARESQPLWPPPGGLRARGGSGGECEQRKGPSRRKEREREGGRKRTPDSSLSLSPFSLSLSLFSPPPPMPMPGPARLSSFSLWSSRGRFAAAASAARERPTTTPSPLSRGRRRWVSLSLFLAVDVVDVDVHDSPVGRGAGPDGGHDGRRRR